MKKTYKYIALAAIALGFAACTQEDDFTPQGNQKGAPIAIASAGVANLTTRATITDDKLVEGGIGVTITSTGNDERYKGSNVKWYGYDGVWELVENEKVVLFEGNSGLQKIYAYYPYASDINPETGNLPVTIPDAYGSDFENYDYLCTKEGISLSQNPISLTLSHAFSKVSVSISAKGNELDGDVVTGISLVNVPRVGVRSATTGAMVPGEYSAKEAIALYGYDSDDTDEEADYFIGYTLPDAATTLDLRVTMQSGRIFTATAPITDGMTDGVHYKIGLNLGKDAVTVGNVIICDWGTPENNVSGSAVTEIFIHSEVSGTKAAIDIVSGATEGVQNAITELLEANTSINTLTVNGTLSDVQQGALAAALADFNGTLIMDMTDAADAIDNLSCTKQLGGYAVADDGTYTVYTVAGLQKWNEAVAGNSKTNLTLGADILLPTRNISVDENGRPSGSNWATVDRFTGTIDGCGHSIVNLRTYGSEASFIDRCSTSSVVKNLTFLTPVVYQSGQSVSVIAGSFSGTLIENCHVIGGSVTGESNCVGGLVGNFVSQEVKIFASTNSAKIKGIKWVGGIVGRGFNQSDEGPAIVACVNTGEVSGNSQVAGITGVSCYLYDVVGCYTTQSVISGADGRISGCYYVAEADTDGEDGTTAVVDETALNSGEVVNAMNTAIDTYNSSATAKVNYKWKVGTALPELVVAE